MDVKQIDHMGPNFLLARHCVIPHRSVGYLNRPPMRSCCRYGPASAPRFAFLEAKLSKKLKIKIQSLMHPRLTHLLRGMDNVLLMGRLRLIRLITRRNQTDPREIKLFLPFIPPLLFAHCCSFLGRMRKYFNHRGPPAPTLRRRHSDMRDH